ncbi:hypothetical protein O9G_006139 [Rozella allomycis CSF55]|uniref:Uncharacterized protein n=1 Tax=Rozella allomycis (strain CSF55) TaxID=988480 RepID=A0A075AQ69_ROZAC|nr:hypothetical protein O9G_006139 [Rozella allomycis CSF55]|eukprot:EPZ32391.1 hypothetical protein O9G_006139 [Rozella allomycis CSF55]
MPSLTQSEDSPDIIEFKDEGARTFVVSWLLKGIIPFELFPFFSNSEYFPTSEKQAENLNHQKKAGISLRDLVSCFLFFLLYADLEQIGLLQKQAENQNMLRIRDPLTLDHFYLVEVKLHESGDSKQLADDQMEFRCWPLSCFLSFAVQTVEKKQVENPVLQEEHA